MYGNDEDGDFMTSGWVPAVMRFMPLFATILMLIFWIYNFYFPQSA